MNPRPRRIAASTGAVAAGLLLLAPLLMAPVPAQATASNCVAVVVDSGSSASGRCMTWRSGLTGAGALSGTRHSYRFSSTGLICSIDGFPANCHVDSTHYWSYWHRAPGSSSWTYSSEGAGTYNPRRGETDGWAYQNGSSRKPRSISFSTICPAPRTPPNPPAKPPPARPPVPAGPAAPPSPAIAPGGGAATRPVAPPAAAAGSGRSPSASASPPGGRSAEGAPASGGAAAQRRALHDPAPAGAPVGPIVATGVGLLAAAGLGTAAWRRTRRTG